MSSKPATHQLVSSHLPRISPLSPQYQYNSHPQPSSPTDATRQHTFNLRTTNLKLPAYNALTDRHLRQFFGQTRVQQHLKKMSTQQCDYSDLEPKDVKEKEGKKETREGKEKEGKIGRTRNGTDLRRNGTDVGRGKSNEKEIVNRNQFLNYLAAVRRKISAGYDSSNSANMVL